jgi:hypothetical protein
MFKRISNYWKMGKACEVIIFDFGFAITDQETDLRRSHRHRG